MSSILIVAPLSDRYSGLGNYGAPSLGPWRLASWLEDHGQVADIWDCNISENFHLPSPEEHKGRDRSHALAEAFVDGMAKDYDLPSYEWIGLSILSDVLPTMLGVVELLRQRYPKAKLIGGNHEVINLSDVLGKSHLDAVLMADAEDSLLLLMQGVEPSKVPGVIWRNFQPKPSREKFEEWNDSIKWSRMPFSRYWEMTAALYPLDSMTEEERLDKLYEIKTVRVHSLVACELACTFCSVKTTRRWASGSMKPSIINLSPDAFERNLLAIKAQVPDVMTIYDSCDEAWLGRGRAEEYLGVLEKIKPVMDANLPKGLRYLVQCRTNDLNEEIIVRAGKVGVRHLTIGVESPVAQVRKDMKKPQSEELVRNVARWGTANGISVYMLFIGFFPTLRLEQVREAIENWRMYISLGATISIEPFAMAYLGTDLADDASLLTEFVGYDIPFSGTPARKLKWATLIWPTDRRVCALLQWVRANLDNMIEEHRKSVGHDHMYKGSVGTVIIDAFERAIDLYDQGKIPPWDLNGEGQRSMVYQDYGDQLSGAEIAAAAKEGKHRTTTRFNSTHALLDDTNAGVKGRIKDPALPYEMAPTPSGLVQLGKPPVKP